MVYAQLIYQELTFGKHSLQTGTLTKNSVELSAVPSSSKGLIEYDGQGPHWIANQTCNNLFFEKTWAAGRHSIAFLFFHVFSCFFLGGGTVWFWVSKFTAPPVWYSCVVSILHIQHWSICKLTVSDGPSSRSPDETCCHDVFAKLMLFCWFFFQARKVMLTNILGRVGKAALQDFILFTVCKWSCFVFDCFNPMDVIVWNGPRKPLVICWNKRLKSKSNYILLTDDTNTLNLKSLVLL